MNVKIESSWKQQLQSEFNKDYFKQLTDFVRGEYLSQKTIYPPPDQIFSAFQFTPFDQVKVVILGQDPYHGPNQANGLCFSVHPEVRTPPSLVNIYKEINQDLDIPIPDNGDLSHWAKQGVLLLNATLTVQAHKAGSHQKKGWEEFTDAAIHQLAQQREKLVFMLWGSYAQKKGAFIDKTKHLVLEAPHPSPLSAHRGFLGCQHFSRCNHYLIENNIQEINWKLNSPQSA